MTQAALENQKEMVNHLIEKGVSGNDNLFYGMLGAISGGNLDLLKYIIGKTKEFQVDESFFIKFIDKTYSARADDDSIKGERKYDEVINFLKEKRNELFPNKNKR